MLSTLKLLLGPDVQVLRRYLRLTLLYGLLCGLSIMVLLPLFAHLLQGETAAAWRWSGVLLLVVVLCWAMRIWVEKSGIAVGIALLEAGRNQLGDHVAQLPIGWFTPHNTARLSHVATQGMMEIAQLPAHIFTPLVTGVVTPVVMLLGLFVLNWQLGLIALISLPLLALMFVLTARLGRHADQRFNQAAAQSSQRLVEFAQAQSVLRAFNGTGASSGFVQQAFEQQQRSARQLIRVSAMSVLFNTWAVQCCFAVLLVLTVAWLSQLLTLNAGYEAVSTVIITLLLVSRFIDPLLDVASYSDVLRGTRNQLQVVADIFAVQPLPTPDITQVPADASVTLCDVGFRYGPGQPEVLKGLNLHIAAGSMTALVGASGSGKTTLLRLLARFFDVTAGSVSVGGVDVRQMSSAQLGSHVSQIFQDTYLFQGSIADNIRLGRPDASEEQIQQVLEAAGIREMLERMPEGLQTQVGEGGARLSGGERQRIAIARALIKEAPILLVDEATAALDAENQALIGQTLARLRGKCTLIVIAHQLSSVAMADQIIVLDNGTLSEQGSPAQLAAKRGLYAHFLAQRRATKGWRIARNSQQGTSS